MSIVSQSVDRTQQSPYRESIHNPAVAVIDQIVNQVEQDWIDFVREMESPEGQAWLDEMDSRFDSDYPI